MLIFDYLPLFINLFAINHKTYKHLKIKKTRRYEDLLFI